jgi:hypothetical protein
MRKNFYIVNIFKDGKPVIANDYPEDFIIPETGDELTITDIHGNEHSGIVTNKRFVIRNYYQELTITLSCKS